MTNYHELTEILSFLYVTLKASTPGDLDSIKSECVLLGLDVDEAVLAGLQDICHKSNSLVSAKSLVSNLTAEKISNIEVKLKRQQREIKENENALEERKKAANAEAEKTKQYLKELAKQSNYHEHITDFTILSSYGKTDLENQIKKGMSNGWKPFGNLAVYHPGANPIPGGKVPDQFFQAMVKFKYD